jgi:hypothetical protein
MIMKKRDPLYWMLAAIAAITVVSGAVQAIAPGFILTMMSAELTPSTSHFFCIVGMFMVLFGGMLLHVLFDSAHHPVSVLWAGLQKFGASGAVGLGVARSLFSSRGLLVAGFDLLSGILILVYWARIRRREIGVKG